MRNYSNSSIKKGPFNKNETANYRQLGIHLKRCRDYNTLTKRFWVPVIWMDEIVGFINDPKPDNFYLYGVWQPIDSQFCENFTATVERGDEPQVKLGESDTALVCTVQEILESRIEMKIQFPRANH
ncbi:MAG: hypothetical protein JWM11_6995 [Planctomycetaceae bacterium]|nr:hypothetical protein [Planctomycetaceae bacterium]